MNKELVIQSSENETQIALLEDKKLVELHKERDDKQFLVGDFYLGKVKKINPGLNAAFVNVGYEKDAFLHYFDLSPKYASIQQYAKSALSGGRKTSKLDDFEYLPEIDKEGKITDVLKSGQEILVQVVKEPISAKGPRISCELSLAGRYVVLVPFSDKISVSQKIRDRAERKRLRSLMESILPKNFGVIIRTVAVNKKVADLDADLRNLVSRWDKSYNNLVKQRAPKRVLSEINKSHALLRDMLNSSFNKIHVDDDTMYDEIKSYISSIAPDKKDIVKQYKGNIPIFDALTIEKQIKASFGKMVAMESGAYLIIEHTEALHVFDVNSGNTSNPKENQEANALKVNLESAAEIARQLRLRDMGGIVVIDFIDMRLSENRKELVRAITEEMRKDKAKHQILPPSKFGLVQITRQRVRPEMDIKTTEVIPIMNKKGSKEVQATILIIDEIENKLNALLTDGAIKNPIIKAHPFVEAYFKRKFFSYQRKWFMNHKKWVKIYALTNFHLMKYQIIDGDRVIA